MIIYRLEYNTGNFWCEFDEFSSKESALKRMFFEKRKKHMKNVEFRLFEVTITEKEIPISPSVEVPI
jgi:hypothetical protein